MSKDASYYDMFDQKDIIDQILFNCDISDSHYAGYYSICGLAMRLRDLYKWEKGLDPWIEKEPAEVLDWIGEKEAKWETLAEKDLNDITIHGISYDPFDVRGINAVLEPYRLFYGGGYARSLKPTFFLAALEEKREIQGYNIYVLGREMARDLFTAPAFTQDDCIVVRREAAKLFLWDQIFYIKKSGRPALKFALENYGVKEQDYDAIHGSLEKIAADESERYIYHELGEIRDTVFDRNVYREIIASFPHSPIELLTRAVKDLLADTNKFGTLRHIIRKGRAVSLGFYNAFLDGLAKELFPEMTDAFRGFTQTRNWSGIEQAVDAGYNTGKDYAETISGIYKEGKQKNNMDWVKDEITKCLLKPLV